jgi:hypothetical protein
VQRGPAKPQKPGGFPANNGVRTQQRTLKGSLPLNPRNIETTEEVINMASKEEVRRWAQARADGQQIAQYQQDAIDRTTRQAGSEGRHVSRIVSGESR